ncbi:MAG: terminase small subunit [Proteobacteria bacterium]|nr:terminase small subunit [Pseudomonadota bacterium]MDA1023566.1 terminase small subunit [Pseudomonadota bacterium]
MPTTKSLSPRHEAFCQHYVLSGNATGAAANAGYSPMSLRNQGYRLTHRADTRARIADIRRGMARAYCLDTEVLLGKLEAIYQCANERGNFHAATRAVDLQARIVRNLAPSPSAKIPDRKTHMTTNDDILRPQADEFAANSIPCAASGRRK